MVSRLGIIIVDGRQYAPPVTVAASQANHTPVMNVYQMPPQMIQNNHNMNNQMFAPPPAYSTNSTLSTNLSRVPTQVTVQNLRNVGHMRPQPNNIQYTSKLAL